MNLKKSTELRVPEQFLSNVFFLVTIATVKERTFIVFANAFFVRSHSEHGQDITLVLINDKFARR